MLVKAAKHCATALDPRQPVRTDHVVVGARARATGAGGRAEVVAGVMWQAVA